MILFSHPTGNANAREASGALYEAGLLSEFWTSVSWDQEHFLNRVLPARLRRELSRRAFSQVRRDQLHCHPWLEVGRLAACKLNLGGLIRHEVGKFSLDEVYRSLDMRLASRLRELDGVRGVYAYEDGALESFRVARKMGLKTVYELPIGYWRSYRDLMEEEAGLQPEWSQTIQGRKDSDEKCQRKDEELALATDIVVASDFVSGTLLKAGPLQALVNVLPYGAPVARQIRIEKKTRNGRLKVLFVGSLTQRKGISYLIQAASRMGTNIELTVIGRRVAACSPLDSALRYVRWIPTLTHRALLEEMSRHDVMVFPSLFEGCALVILEAMSQGLPVITTPNTGALHFISDGVDGFIVPIRDVDAIVEKLEILTLDRDRLAGMSGAATQKAAQHRWQNYRREFVSILRHIIEDDATLRPANAQPPQEACPC